MSDKDVPQAVKDYLVLKLKQMELEVTQELAEELKDIFKK